MAQKLIHKGLLNEYSNENGKKKLKFYLIFFIFSLGSLISCSKNQSSLNEAPQKEAVLPDYVTLDHVPSRPPLPEDLSLPLE